LKPTGKPLLFNMVSSGKSPVLSLDELTQMGFGFAICPVEPMLAMHKAVKKLMTDFYSNGCTTKAIASQLTPFEEYNRFVGLTEAVAQERRFTEVD
jgi:methylisocitrate lyase